MIDLPSIATIATEAVAIGHNIFLDSINVTIDFKGTRDLVTNIDTKIQDTIEQFLVEKTPNLPFYGEEGYSENGLFEQEYAWIIDPIDGTSNYVHGMELCAISLALLHYGEPVMGVIDAPKLRKIYTAILGSGAYCNTHPISVSEINTIADAIINLGDYAVSDDAQTKNQVRFATTEALALSTHRIRMIGTAALDLAFLAEGHTDAVIMHSNNPWDVAAGKIIAQEAGAIITTLSNELHTLQSTSILASTPRIHDPIIHLLQPLL